MDTEARGVGNSDPLDRLRELHKQMVRKCGSRFKYVAFRAKSVPGWIYIPPDRVIPDLDPR